MNTRTNIRSIVRNVLTLVGAAALISSPAIAQQQSFVAIEVPVVVQSVELKSSPKAPVQIVEETETGRTNPTGPICGTEVWIDPRVQIADYNQNGVVDATDLYDFFVVWVTGKVTADINGDGWVDAADVWFYLEIWNAVITAKPSPVTPDKSHPAGK